MTTNDGGTVSHQFGQPVTVLVNSQPVGGKRVTKTVGNPPNLKTPLVTLETSGKPQGNHRSIPGNTVQPVEKHRMQFHQPSPFDLGSIRRNGQHRVVPMKVVPGETLSLSGSKSRKQPQRHVGHQTSVSFVLDHLQQTVNFVEGVHLGNPTLHTHRQCLCRIRRHQDVLK